MACCASSPWGRVLAGITVQKKGNAAAECPHRFLQEMVARLDDIIVELDEVNIGHRTCPFTSFRVK